jgi:signal transduction histidine kinase/CheY-like chemotaxis protein/CHASE3 domain sensor protein
MDLMATNRPTSPAASRGVDPSLSIGLTIALLFFVGSSVLTFLNTRSLNAGARQVDHSHEVLAALDDVLTLVKDAETGQRGFIITGNDRYLDDHTRAVDRVDARFRDLEQMVHDNSSHRTQLSLLREQVDTKLKELAETIALRRNRGFDAARDVVVTDRGKNAMDTIRQIVAAMQRDERSLLSQRLAATDEAFRVAVWSVLLTGFLGVFLVGTIYFLAARAANARQRERWLLSAQSGLSAAMLGDKQLSDIGEGVVKFLAELMRAQAGALFARDNSLFRRVATYGAPSVEGVPETLSIEDGLVGRAVKDGRSFVLESVPPGYLSIGSSLGRGLPEHLLIAPFRSNGEVNAVIELGFFQPVGPADAELLERVAETVGVAIRSANYRSNLQNLLEETQRQSEELQAQSEELRVSNEELEEQGRAMKESQARLEVQQQHLEETNAQLEMQRDDITRTSGELRLKARELEQASRYKSDFLANMSHELRTPLNSSLILAKLLADNPDGNLSDEQVKFAETIRSSGNDLLCLINDILDLSKIEAGHMEIRPEEVLLSEIAANVRRTFEPLASEKRLRLTTSVGADCPASIVSDRQRLEQVLKNLVSNAVKFTEQGEVELTVEKAFDGRLAFAIRDTGIGIAEEQREVVFEAFRQADGTTNRKYGGTGLGLSISRELTRLLGGHIGLESEIGKGSTFTVTLPETFEPDAVRPRTERTGGDATASAARPRVSAAAARAVEPHPRRMIDDRERLIGSRRVILVVEDDEPFARILYDLAHELDFQCLVATTAEEAVGISLQYRPGAVVLDIGLPDHSGLTVLDRLKHDARTRHIPVHVVSAGDYAESALSLGAVGYMLKPVKREELMAALRGIETHLARKVRRVLVVEDDPVQQESMRKLLGSQEVEAVGVGTVNGCLERLRTETFDCMVLDLSLPDATGYSLLETLSREDAYAFPPVIVYTGRDLSVEEEQRLRRYSKSIIIKGAKSPERLLDEVTLFLHQVVADLPPAQQRMLEKARSRDAALEGRRILVVEDDVRNVFALSSIFEPRGAKVEIARNGREALEFLERSGTEPSRKIDLVLMDVMMPEMDGIAATREIRKRHEWKKLPVIMLTAKAMKDDQQKCLDAGANDYMAKPLDVEKLLSLVRVWMTR